MGPMDIRKSSPQCCHRRFFFRAYAARDPRAQGEGLPKVAKLGVRHFRWGRLQRSAFHLRSKPERRGDPHIYIRDVVPTAIRTRAFTLILQLHPPEGTRKTLDRGGPRNRP